MHRDNEISGDDIRQPLNRRAGSLRFTDHAHDLRQHCLTSDPLSLHHYAAGPIDSAADYSASF